MIDPYLQLYHYEYPPHSNHGYTFGVPVIAFSQERIWTMGSLVSFFAYLQNELPALDSIKEAAEIRSGKAETLLIS